LGSSSIKVPYTICHYCGKKIWASEESARLTDMSKPIHRLYCYHRRCSMNARAVNGSIDTTNKAPRPSPIKSRFEIMDL